MTEEKDKRKFMVGGYEFTSKEDAQIAKDELNAIKYVSSKTNSKDPKQVYLSLIHISEPTRPY